VGSEKRDSALGATLGYPQGGGLVASAPQDTAPVSGISRVDVDDTVDDGGVVLALGGTVRGVGGIAPVAQVAQVVPVVPVALLAQVPRIAGVTGVPALTAVDATEAPRTTVLPRRRAAGAAPPEEEARPRFHRVRKLGEGGMGEVELVRDNDIRRTVAVKRLRGDTSSDAALARFADEVRIVGQLEHPSIVPIYDVGRDEEGRVYLVMKHLQGETMEDIIAKLQEGTPGYAERFPLQTRIHLFLAVLDAIRYAHARGIVHRDLKPANIMIGPYGEVTVLDWGIAKVIKAPAVAKAQPLDKTAVDSVDVPFATRVGSLAGTPLYMSPEQAAGRNDEVDEASDAYTLCLVLYEWLTLVHPLRSERSVAELLARVIARDYKDDELVGPAFAAKLPAEYIRLLLRGLRRARAARFASVAALETEISAIQSGRVRVQCHLTLTKRGLHDMMHFVDRHPMAYTLMLGAMILAVVGGGVAAVVFAVRGH
jgi:serine/threonine-protein kinase